MRETEEEVGLRRDEIDVLAELEPINTRTTGFRVHPFVACIRNERWTVSSNEIAAVLTPRVAEIADPRRRDTTEVSFLSWPQPQRVERLALEGGHTLWGFTLRLLDLTVSRLLNDEWRI